MVVKQAMNAERAADDAYRIAGLRRKAGAHVDVPRKPAEGGEPADLSVGQHPTRNARKKKNPEAAWIRTGHARPPQQNRGGGGPTQS
jgi:hypothetical protein